MLLKIGSLRINYSDSRDHTKSSEQETWSHPQRIVVSFECYVGLLQVLVINH